MSVDLAAAIAEVHEGATTSTMSLLAEDAHGVLGFELEAHVHLDAADADRS